MIYLYDNAIVKDLEDSFNTGEDGSKPVVKIVDPENVINLAAQIADDEISFPIIALTRDANTPIDNSRINFTRLHKGNLTVMDTKTNELYYEKCVPIQLNYQITVLTTSIMDMDELVKELMFKYIQMYFLHIQLPYECNRMVRFGAIIDPDKEIERSSGTSEYLSTGKLYQSIIPLKIEGAVEVSYTPVKLRRAAREVEVE